MNPIYCIVSSSLIRPWIPTKGRPSLNSQVYTFVSFKFPYTLVSLGVVKLIRIASGFLSIDFGDISILLIGTGPSENSMISKVPFSIFPKASSWTFSPDSSSVRPYGFVYKVNWIPLKLPSWFVLIETDYSRSVSDPVAPTRRSWLLNELPPNYPAVLKLLSKHSLCMEPRSFKFSPSRSDVS